MIHRIFACLAWPRVVGLSSGVLRGTPPHNGKHRQTRHMIIGFQSRPDLRVGMGPADLFIIKIIIIIMTINRIVQDNVDRRDDSQHPREVDWHLLGRLADNVHAGKGKVALPSATRKMAMAMEMMLDVAR